MIALFRQIILCVTAASLFGAVALALVPKGALHEIVRLAVGLVLILSLAAPLRSLTFPKLHITNQWSQEQQQSDEQLADALVQEVERQAADYIVQLAAQRGISCTAQVDAKRTESGVVSLTRAELELSGDSTEGEIRRLIGEIADLMGIPEGDITVREEGME